jgi:hypothetical protein
MSAQNAIIKLELRVNLVNVKNAASLFVSE